MQGMSKKKRGASPSRKKRSRSRKRSRFGNVPSMAGSSRVEVQGGKRTLTITVHAATPSPNSWVRAHWSTYQQIKQQWRDLIWVAAIKHFGKGKFGPPVENASLTVKRKGLKELDYDNLVGGFKPVIDALCTLGFLSDDTTNVIQTLAARQESVSKRDEVLTEITIVEI